MNAVVNGTFRHDINAKLTLNCRNNNIIIRVFDEKELECWVISTENFFKHIGKKYEESSLKLIATNQLEYPTFSTNGTQIFAHYSKTVTKVLFNMPKNHKIAGYNLSTNVITLVDGYTYSSQTLKCDPNAVPMAIEVLNLPKVSN